MLRGDLTAVIETLERTGKDRDVPWLEHARSNLASCLLELGKPEEARALFDAVLAPHPKTHPGDRDGAADKCRETRSLTH